MTIKKGKPTLINYAAISRSFALAEKILKYSDSGAGETQNKPDDLVILSALLKLKKRLDDLSKKIRSVKAVSQAVDINRKALVEGKVFTDAEIERGYVRNWGAVRNEARSILKEAAHVEIRLPSVPAGDGTAWSFERLQNWRDESLSKISKLLQKCIRKMTSSDKPEQKTTPVKEPLLAKLKNPVTCVEVSGIIRKRSDNIAETLKRRQYPVIKAGRKYYCNAEHAGIVWPRWKKHWQSKQNQ